MVTEKSRKFSIYLFNIERTIPFYKSLHLPCLLSFVKKRTGAFVCQEICSFTSSFSPTHLSTGQYRVSFFHFEEHFHHQEKRFLICERTCPDLIPADIFGETEKAHMRANLSQAKICKKGN